MTEAERFNALAKAITNKQTVIYDHAVIDEAQDISVAHLRFFAALGNDRSNALFFAGDLGLDIPAAILMEISVSTSADDPGRCGLTTERHIRYEPRQTGCWACRHRRHGSRRTK